MIISYHNFNCEINFFLVDWYLENKSNFAEWGCIFKGDPIVILICIKGPVFKVDCIIFVVSGRW